MIEKIPTAAMTHEQWVQSRRNGIGGSDAATVLGLNPYSSPYALWAVKTGMMEPEDISGKECVRLGTYLEEYVAKRFTEETGKKVRRENYILKNTDYPFAHANVDRLLVGEKAGLECKTTSELNMRRFRGGEYPANYYCQCMHYMAITGYPKWYLAVLIGNREFRVFEILRDEGEISALMESERQFWELVESKTPPMADDSKATESAIEAIHPEIGETVDLTPVCDNLRQYLALKSQVKDLEAQMQTVANAIKNFMGGASCGESGICRVSWKEYSSSRFDKALFQKDNPDVDLRKYQKTTVSRRFEVKEI